MHFMESWISGVVAQALLCNSEVIGSNPVGSAIHQDKKGSVFGPVLFYFPGIALRQGSNPPELTFPSKQTRANPRG